MNRTYVNFAAKSLSRFTLVQAGVKSWQQINATNCREKFRLIGKKKTILITGKRINLLSH
jgi:hypothetical protein